MIPIRDDNPTHHTPYVTVALIVVNVLVFLLEVMQPGPEGMQKFIWKYGFVPAELQQGSERLSQEMRQLNQHQRPQMAMDRFGNVVVEKPQQLPVQDATVLPAWINIFSCMFLHGGWMHLIGNMLYLWIFGNNIEDRLGPVLFIVFYLLTGVVGNLAHTIADPDIVPLVGASGAISGVMGGYVILFPKARILAVMPAYFYWFTFTLPAWIFLGVYYLIQNLVPSFSGSSGSVAYWAHIGGFAAGAAAIYLFPHRAIPKGSLPFPARARGSFDNADFDL